MRRVAAETSPSRCDSTNAVGKYIPGARQVAPIWALLSTSTATGKVVLDAVALFGADCSQLHNDSTSVTLSGRYACVDRRARARC